MRLCVNIDHFATLREARGGLEPDPVTAAQMCELYGAEGIVCHLREDRRHINDRDLRLLRETVKTKLDLEMAITDELLGIAVETLPELATLVPEKRKELTTESGLDVLADAEKVAYAIRLLHEHDIEVSLFLDPIDEQIEAAAECGADIIEIHTGDFANARSIEEMHEHLGRIRSAAAYARTLNLGVYAGHGLNYVNVHYITGIPDIEEVSIGHALVSRAMFVGLKEAVRDMLALLRDRNASIISP
jgi:pyridoxine 5-phosphate synthase